MGKQKKLKFKHSNVLASSIVASDIVKDVNVPEIIGNYCINSEYIAIDRSEVIKNLDIAESIDGYLSNELSVDFVSEPSSNFNEAELMQ